MTVMRRALGVICLMLLICLAPAGIARAAQSTSTNYSVDQVFFGNGGELNACSTNYCSKQAAGETAVGNVTGTNYQAQAGFNVNRDEYLQFIVNTASIDFGTLTTASAKTATATFSVKAYLSSGYQVIAASDPPANNGRPLTAMGTAAASSPGTEQFGINLVANTSPASYGANPVQVPSGSYSFGAAASGYNTANQFKYAKGDVVASSPKSTGETDFTISYLVNISPLTPGGTYTGPQVFVATATF